MVLEEHELGEGTIETTVMNGIPTSLTCNFVSNSRNDKCVKTDRT